ncbi:CASTOR/POLLUX-related putative ion channel [Protaetiibacter intestinalis]|uniref:Potassium transporter TrkA n=1 Tax=Protaetiibacter intestinalis TaxID=2419774 RepID=A0A387B6K2_9MICO|nr:NAD-binding protein [Protaetiibacter intestinalis]AYF96835.1 potassium transporter TrkA [Protaetiibacter intestinalis]
MTEPTRGERIRYRFDTWMSKGTIALIGLLGAATFAFVLVLALIVWALPLHPADEPEGDFFDIFWGNLMRTLDPGTMGGDEGWGFRIAMLVVTLGGLVIVASLIGIVSGGFDAKVEELRKGRSRVLEKDHTLILGWSDKVFSIVSELVIANESRGRAAVVILADRDKLEMEEELRAAVGKTGKTVVICRSGDPMALADLELGSPHTARSIILLAPEESEDPDSVVVKAALAITNNPNRREGAYHVVGELRDPANLEAARLVGRDEVEWVLANELISRITVQTCRQSGLSVVYSELLAYEGDEIYMAELPELVGHDYRATQLAFVDSSVMGIVKGDATLINPPADTLYEAGDLLVLIAEDDSTIRSAPAGTPDAAAIAVPTEEPVAPERTLVLGYNPGLAFMLRELDQYVSPGSSVLVVADVEEPGFPALENLTVVFRRGDVTSRRVLDALEAELADHIIVLSDPRLNAQRSDAKTLITLLHLRDIAERAAVDLNVVSEMLDDGNRELAEVTDADDFIVSDKLVALTLTQLSENKRLADVFDVLFAAEGSEIYLRPASHYIREGEEADFYTVVEAAQRRGETAIGFRVGAQAHRSADAYGVVVNPRKDERRRFAADDRIIVLAED